MSVYRTEPCAVCGEGVLVDRRVRQGDGRPTHWSCRKENKVNEPYQKVNDDEVVIRVSVLRTLPPRIKVVGVYDDVPDMDGRKFPALRVMWTDEWGPRDGYFRLSNGAYLCDHFDQRVP